MEVETSTTIIIRLNKLVASQATARVQVRDNGQNKATKIITDGRLYLKDSEALRKDLRIKQTALSPTNT